MELTRRSLLGGAAAGAASLVLSAPDAQAAGGKTLNIHKNEEFYVNGKFDADIAKKAYYEMMEFYGCPIVDRLRGQEFWTLDFGLNKFTEIGMAGIFWVNNKEHNYFGHEIYLLPGQAIPEHKHLKTADAAPKLEAWQVRYGEIHIYGEGAPTPGVEARIPPTHKDCVKSKLEKKLLPGEVGSLAAAEEWHFMVAGPQGAIVTEYATYHDGAGLRFSHPDAKM